MARQVLPIVGAAIGAYFGGPSGAQLGYAIGSLVGNAVDPQIIKGPRIGDAGIQTTAEGVYRPVIFGTAAVMGNVIERGNRQIKKRKTSQGKGGPVTEEERVYWTFAIRICEGPIGGVIRIWEDEKLVYDARPDSTIVEETGDFGTRCRIYKGDDEQLPDPDLEVIHGAGNAHAYPGTAYIVFPNYDLTDRRESIPSYRFEVAQETVETFIGSVMAGGETMLNYHVVSSSGDGNTWSDPEPTLFGTAYLAAGNDERFVGYNNTGARYTDDFGATWTNSGGTPWTGIGVGRAAVWDETILVPADLDGVFRSTDNGENFEVIPGPRPAYIAWQSEGVALGASVYDTFLWLSVDGGRTWSHGPNHGLTFPGGGVAVHGGGVVGFGGAAVFGGSAGGTAAVAFGDISDTDLTVIQIPGEPGEFVSALWCRVTDDLSLWVAGLSNGHLYRSEDLLGWVRCANDMGVRCNQITSRANRFFVAGGLSGTGVIKYSDDGDHWVTATQPLAYSAISIVCRSEHVNQQVGLPVVLGDVVAGLHARAGARANQFDATALTDMVDGVVFAGDYTCADGIKSLAPVYFFDGPEYDDGGGFRIIYTKRGGAVARTITEDDLVAIPDETVREDSLERPRVLHMAYQSPTIGYAAAKASPARNSPDVRVVGEVSVQVPVAFSDVTEAARRADVMLRQAWEEVGGEESMQLGSQHMDLVPSDVIAISLRGQVRRARLTEASIEPGIMRVKLLPDRQSAYTSNLTGIPLPDPTPPPPSIVGPSVLSVPDIAALNDGNDRLLVYPAISGQTSAWYGAALQLSTDGGATWLDAGVVRSGAVMGVLKSNITAASSHFTDTTNVAVVTLYNPDDELSSLTDAQLLSEGGSFAIEWSDLDGTHWEILQGRDAVRNVDGDWEVSHLLRGRLNSTSVDHTPGARVVFLDGVLSVDMQSGWIGRELKFRAVSLGTSPDAAAVLTMILRGNSQMEWPVASLSLSRDGDTISASAVLRHRLGTEVRPLRSVNWQALRWTATDGANTATIDVLGTVTSFDVSGWASPVTVSAAQINRITGAGPTVSEQIA